MVRASKRVTKTKRAIATATWVAGDEEGNSNGSRSNGEDADAHDNIE